MTFQDAVWIIQGLIGIIMTIGGIFMNNLWAEIKNLRARDHNRTSEVAALKVLVVGDYVKREELRDIMKDITHEVRLGFGDLHKKMDSGFSELYDELKSKADK